MADPVAVWGAVTGTIGTVIAARREVIARRKRLALTHGTYFNVRRDEPGHVSHAWALIQFWNTGGRPLAVEHAGFRYFVVHDEGNPPYAVERRAEVALEGPIEVPVDGQSQRVGTPLGPLMKAGLDPWSPVQAFAVTTGAKEWFGAPEPLVKEGHAHAVGSSPERLMADLDDLADRAELPPAMFGGELIALNREDPYLPGD